MDKINVHEAIDHDRRRFFGAAALSFAAAELGAMGAAHAETKPAPPPVNNLGTNTSFAPLKQIDAGVLNIGYAEAGPPNGSPVILLHGWPYDIHDYIEVAPILAAQGYRVIVPHLRGHGSTSFLDAATPRSGQQAAIGVDVIALMDALKIPTAVLAGYDWGGRAACVAAALWPERCTGLVSVNDYLIQDIAHAGAPLPAKFEWGIWTQFYFATERGRAGLAANRNDIARLLWTNESPTWRFDDATFQRSAASFDKDYVDVVIHSYLRARRSAICGCRGEARGASRHHGPHSHPRRGGQFHHPRHRWPVFRGQVLRQTNPPSGAECGPRPTAAGAEGLRRRSDGSDKTALIRPNREVSAAAICCPTARSIPVASRVAARTSKNRIQSTTAGRRL